MHEPNFTSVDEPTSGGERANAKSAVNPELQRDSGYGP